MSEISKNEIRSKMRLERAKTPPQYRNLASRQICTHISFLEHYHRATHIGLYHATDEEIDLTELWHIACDDKKLCYFPMLNEERSLSFLPATPDTLFKKNKYSILEPQVSQDLAIPVDQLDLIIMPLVAFDFHCNRLGMGSGYYDKTLEKASHPFLIGVGYQFQRVNAIEANAWDVPLNGVMTQRAIYWRNIDQNESLHLT